MVNVAASFQRDFRFLPIRLKGEGSGTRRILDLVTEAEERPLKWV